MTSNDLPTYTARICCRDFRYPRWYTALCVKHCVSRPHEDSFVWKALNFVLAAGSIAMFVFAAYELATSAAPPTGLQFGDVRTLCALNSPPATPSPTPPPLRQRNSSSASLSRSRIQTIPNYTPNICFGSEQAASMACPQLVDVIEYSRYEPHSSASAYRTLRSINLIVSTAAFWLIAWSYYTVLWRHERTLPLATCGCSEKCCSCCCSVERCGERCDDCGTQIDSAVLAVDFCSLPLIVILTLVGVVLLAWANADHYRVERGLYYNDPLELADCPIVDLSSNTLLSVAVFSAAAVGEQLTELRFIVRHPQLNEAYAAAWRDDLFANVWPGLLVLFATILLMCGDCLDKFWEQSLEQDRRQQPSAGRQPSTADKPQPQHMQPAHQPTTVATGPSGLPGSPTGLPGSPTGYGFAPYSHHTTVASPADSHHQQQQAVPMSTFGNNALFSSAIS